MGEALIFPIDGQSSKVWEIKAYYRLGVEDVFQGAYDEKPAMFFGVSDLARMELKKLDSNPHNLAVQDLVKDDKDWLYIVTTEFPSETLDEYMARNARRDQYGFLTEEFQGIIRSLLSVVSVILSQGFPADFSPEHIYMIGKVPKLMLIGGCVADVNRARALIDQLVGAKNDYVNSKEAIAFFGSLWKVKPDKYPSLSDHPFLQSATEKRWKIVEVVARARKKWSVYGRTSGEPDCNFGYSQHLRNWKPRRYWRRPVLDPACDPAYMNVYRGSYYGDARWDLVRFVRNACLHINDYKDINKKDGEIINGLVKMFPNIFLEVYDLGASVEYRGVIHHFIMRFDNNVNPNVRT